MCVRLSGVTEGNRVVATPYPVILDTSGDLIPAIGLYQDANQEQWEDLECLHSTLGYTNFHSPLHPPWCYRVSTWQCHHDHGVGRRAAAMQRISPARHDVDYVPPINFRMRQRNRYLGAGVRCCVEVLLSRESRLRHITVLLSNHTRNNRSFEKQRPQCDPQLGQTEPLLMKHSMPP